MKKISALLIAGGLLACMAMPVSAAEQISTYKGDQELVLEEAGDVDLTREELIEKAQKAMEKAEDIAFHISEDAEINLSFEQDGTQKSVDYIAKMEMTDNKNGDHEYRYQKTNTSYLETGTDETFEEYLFTNADGRRVSVKNNETSETEDESGETWVAEVVEEEAETSDDLKTSGDLPSIDTFLSDDLYKSFVLLDKMYTDGEAIYYVLKAKTSDAMGAAIGELEEMLGEIEIESNRDCYLLFAEDGMLESLYIDLTGIEGHASGTGYEFDFVFSKCRFSGYTDAATEIIIPKEVQAAGDAAA